jgi:hypothetical protein
VQKTFRRELDAFSTGEILTNKQLADIDHVAKITSTSMYNKVKSGCLDLLSTLAALSGDEIEEEEYDEEEDDGGEDHILGRTPPPKKHPYCVSINAS